MELQSLESQFQTYSVHHERKRKWNLASNSNSNYTRASKLGFEIHYNHFY